MTALTATKKRITIIGMGLTGLSCARYFAAKHLPFRVVDSREMPPMAEQFAQEFPQVEILCGTFYSGLFTKDDLLVVSPGMSLKEPAIAEALAAGAGLSSDIQIFVEVVTQPIIAITGSNGKSTVTTLAGEMLKAVGLDVGVAGNIGVPVLQQLLQRQQPDIYVLELSSFQLERLPALGAKVATILNVSEDHMDRYADMQAYLEAKQRIFAGAEHAVVNRDDDASVPPSAIDSISFGLSEPEYNALGVLQEADGEWLVLGQRKLVKSDKLKIKGRHNIANALAALGLCQFISKDWQAFVDTLCAFPGLPHRCQWVADINGVSFYNDSKATNVGAAVAAINGLAQTDRKLWLIAGGQDKDSDFKPLALVIEQQVAGVFVIGKDGEKIIRAVGEDRCVRAASLVEAVSKAYQAATSGDVVLLAPACASFDMFKNYEDRGNCFVAAVKQLAA